MHDDQSTAISRRDAMLAAAATTIGAALGSSAAQSEAAVSAGPLAAAGTLPEKRKWGEYTGERLNRVAFPLGGMGAGMICLEGTGALSHVSLRNKPEVFNEPCTFAAICVKGDDARRARARRAGAGLEALRPAGHGQRRRRARRSACRGSARPTFRARVSRSARVTLARPGRAAGGRDHRLEPLRAGRRRQRQPAGGRARIPLHQPDRRSRSRRCSPGTRRTSWPSARTPRRCKSAPGGFVLWSGPGKDKPLGGRRLLGHRRRSGGQGQPRLVPRRLVRPADHGLEGHRRRRVLSSGRRSPRAAPSPGATLFVPFTLAPRRGEDDRRCGWPGTSARRTCASARTRSPSRPADRPGHVSARGTPAGSPDIDEVTAYWREHYDELRAADAAVQRLLLRHDAAAGGGRGGGRQPDDPQVAHRAAPGRRPALGVGRLQRQRRLLPRLLHARLELRPGHPAPVPRPGADAARDRVRPVAGRPRAPDVPQRAADPARRRTTSTPRPTASWAAS